MLKATNSIVSAMTLGITTELEDQNCHSKYRTCASDGNGNVYFFPFHPFYASKVIKIDTNNNEISILQDFNCGMNWRRAIHASNGFIYEISYVNDIIKFNPTDLSFEKTKLSIDNRDNIYQYCDLVEHNDENLYALPYNATKVVKIDMRTLNSTTVGGDLGNEVWKWCSSVVGKDNCIYGIQYDAPHVG